MNYQLVTGLSRDVDRIVSKEIFQVIPSRLGLLLAKDHDTAILETPLHHKLSLEPLYCYGIKGTMRIYQYIKTINDVVLRGFALIESSGYLDPAFRSHVQTLIG
jgi:hypothetical protein